METSPILAGRSALVIECVSVVLCFMLLPASFRLGVGHEGASRHAGRCGCRHMGMEYGPCETNVTEEAAYLARPQGRNVVA
jgi:hypothetical protein